MTEEQRDGMKVLKACLYSEFLSMKDEDFTKSDRRVMLALEQDEQIREILDEQ